MGIKTASAKVFTDYRRQRDDGTYPIKIRIIYKGKSYEYKLPLLVTKAEDQMLQTGRFGKNDSLRRINTKMIGYLTKANEIIGSMPNFNVKTFEKAFLGSSLTEVNSDKLDIIKSLKLRSIALKKEGRISYSQSYLTTANSLESFNTKISFEELNVDFLKQYEEYLLNREVSQGTVGVYMRNIRTIYNEAIEQKIIAQDNYPFGRKKYTIPQVRTKKTAISREDVQKLLTYKPLQGSSMEKARDFWLFMYLTNGLNMKDVCLLKNSDIKPNFDGIKFFRAKTVRTTRHNRVEIEVWYHERVKAIIKPIILKYSSNLLDKNSYIFPILYFNVTPENERRLVQNFTRFVNKNMKKVALELGMVNVPNTNVARHTFVTIIINSGVPLTEVKDSVGHNSITTTTGYTGTLPTERKKEYSEYLID